MTDAERIDKLKVPTCDRCGAKLRGDECRECESFTIFDSKRDDWMKKFIRCVERKVLDGPKDIDHGGVK